jgi:chaperonin GroES
VIAAAIFSVALAILILAVAMVIYSRGKMRVLRPPMIKEGDLWYGVLGDRVLVRPDPDEVVTKWGLIIPDTAVTTVKPTQFGTVLAVGSGRITVDGRRVGIPVVPGDRILFSRYGNIEYTAGDDQRYVICPAPDVALIVRGEFVGEFSFERTPEDEPALAARNIS